MKQLDMEYNIIKKKQRKLNRAFRVREGPLLILSNIKIISRIFFYIIYKYYICIRKLIRQNFNIDNMKNNQTKLLLKANNTLTN